MRRVSAAAEQATAAQFSELTIAPKQLGAHLQRPLPARGLCAPLPCTAFSTLPCKASARDELQLRSCAPPWNVARRSLDAAESLQPAARRACSGLHHHAGCIISHVPFELTKG